MSTDMLVKALMRESELSELLADEVLARDALRQAHGVQAGEIKTLGSLVVAQKEEIDELHKAWAREVALLEEGIKNDSAILRRRLDDIAALKKELGLAGHRISELLTESTEANRRITMLEEELENGPSSTPIRPREDITRDRLLQILPLFEDWEAMKPARMKVGLEAPAFRTWFSRNAVSTGLLEARGVSNARRFRITPTGKLFLKEHS